MHEAGDSVRRAGMDAQLFQPLIAAADVSAEFVAQRLVRLVIPVIVSAG